VLWGERRRGDDVSYRVALVTGAGRRIGRAIALTLAGDGYAIAVHHSRSAGEARATVAEIEASGGRAVALEADLAESGAAVRLLEDCATALGAPTCLVNNASLFLHDELASLEEGQWDLQLAVNARAPVMLARAMAARLPEGTEGTIVNIADQRVLRPVPQFFSYGISKSALWAATEMLALALAPRIRVNAIAPGPVLQSIHQSSEEFAAEVAGTPIGRGPSPEEVAAAVRFILSSRAMTGQLLVLDGGQHLAPRPAVSCAPARLAPEPRLRHVLIDGLDVMTMIGIHPHEKMKPQRVVTSIDMTVEERGTPGSDRFDEVVDYERIVVGVRKICRAGHVNLVETLAERVAAVCLEDPRVRSVTVRIEKPEAFPDCRAVGVLITRSRSGT
jgi:dihydroneopterin aldolase